MVLVVILPLEKESVVQGGLHPVDRLFSLSSCQTSKFYLIMMCGQDSKLKLTNCQDVLFNNLNYNEGCFIITTGVETHFFLLLLRKSFHLKQIIDCMHCKGNYFLL